MSLLFNWSSLGEPAMAACRVEEPQGYPHPEQRPEGPQGLWGCLSPTPGNHRTSHPSPGCYPSWDELPGTCLLSPGHLPFSLWLSPTSQCKHAPPALPSHMSHLQPSPVARNYWKTSPDGPSAHGDLPPKPLISFLAEAGVGWSLGSPPCLLKRWGATEAPGALWLRMTLSGAGWICHHWSHSPSPSPRGGCCRAVPRQHRGSFRPYIHTNLEGRPLPNQLGGHIRSKGRGGSAPGVPTSA